ncbi:hypothetical protein C8246_12635 [Paracidovorax avenae]|uniref:Transmembrane protein n=1 Tax=Paracidovorax citrulli TaxID=80869 RepID=A0ABY9ANM7_PARCI|nr:hypothetical protein [Paracidovorax citrulli]AVS92493.1 hypothetical protein C8246_12635 [Paracidovorax avenae]MVT29621.1 hypothetical protein [Paracidovorax citrulli]UMT85169.1 hypothetical protein FRC75_18365 [Paracidovorax citrulli]WIY28997.1 hypothetical protein QRO09_18375 [Paracidovorax citrulli]WIY44559.1 hypothetical protein QRO12_02405 [Paracidovorax citrulli]
MTRPAERRGAMSIVRSLVHAAIWVGLLIAVAFAINVLGIRAVGSAEAWEQWIKAHAGHLLVWRISVYGCIAFGWWRIRRVDSKKDRPLADSMRIRRAVIAAMAIILIGEISAIGSRW